VRSYIEPDGSQAPAAIHCCLDVDYYSKAVDLVSTTIGHAVFLVFADDENYARTLLQPLQSVVPLVYLHDLDDWKSLGEVGEMALMALCDHHILANSTYSWWAAYLRSSRRTIIGPLKWFGPDGPSPVDLLPTTWTLL